MRNNKEAKQIALSYSDIENFRKMLDEFNQKLVGLNSNYDELVKHFDSFLIEKQESIQQMQLIQEGKEENKEIAKSTDCNNQDNNNQKKIIYLNPQELKEPFLSYTVSSEDSYNILNNQSDNNPNEVNNLESKKILESNENRNNQQILDNKNVDKINPSNTEKYYNKYNEIIELNPLSPPIQRIENKDGDITGKLKFNEESSEISPSQNSIENNQINFNNNHTNLLQNNKNINKKNIIPLDKFVYIKKSPEIEHIEKDGEDKIKNIKVISNDKNAMKEINFIPFSEIKEENKNGENFVFLTNNLKNLCNNKVKKKINEERMEEEKNEIKENQKKIEIIEEEKDKNIQLPEKENKQKETKIIINIPKFEQWPSKELKETNINNSDNEDINNELKGTKINKINIKKVNDAKPKKIDKKENNVTNKEITNNSELKNKIDNILKSEKLDLSFSTKTNGENENFSQTLFDYKKFNNTKKDLKKENNLEEEKQIENKKLINEQCNRWIIKSKNNLSINQDSNLPTYLPSSSSSPSNTENKKLSNISPNKGKSDLKSNVSFSNVANKLEENSNETISKKNINEKDKKKEKELIYFDKLDKLANEINYGLKNFEEVQDVIGRDGESRGNKEKLGEEEEKMGEINENIIILNKGIGVDINKDFDSLNENEEVKTNKSTKYQDFLKHKHKKDKKKEKTYDDFFKMKHGNKKPLFNNMKKKSIINETNKESISNYNNKLTSSKNSSLVSQINRIFDDFK